MKVALKLAELLHNHRKVGQRGLIKDIVREFKESGIKIERHTVAAMLNNQVKYLSLDTLADICEFLIKRGVPAASLPGALFELVPEVFMEMLSKSRDLAFCLGQRHNEEWGADFVIATDSQLQSELLAGILRCKRPTEEAAGDTTPVESVDYHRLHQLYVTAPSEGATPAPSSAVRDAAQAHYGWLTPATPGRALIALGSNKVNSVVELILAKAFSTTPFESQDDVARPKDRACPFMFRYRPRDPKPSSCCGGMQLARNAQDSGPGIYYETKKGKWEYCPCEDASPDHESRDAAFVCYLHRPSLNQIELACGGFSGRATGALASTLEPIIRQLRPPQFDDGYELGVFLITFVFPPGPTHGSMQPTEHHVIRLDDEVIKRRVAVK